MATASRLGKLNLYDLTFLTAFAASNPYPLRSLTDMPLLLYDLQHGEPPHEDHPRQDLLLCTRMPSRRRQAQDRLAEVSRPRRRHHRRADSTHDPPDHRTREGGHHRVRRRRGLVRCGPSPPPGRAYRPPPPRPAGATRTRRRTLPAGRRPQSLPRSPQQGPDRRLVSAHGAASPPGPPPGATDQSALLGSDGPPPPTCHPDNRARPDRPPDPRVRRRCPPGPVRCHQLLHLHRYLQRTMHAGPARQEQRGSR